MEQLPLEGIRVVDFGWVWAVPVLGQHLADFGAEVIKVESLTHLDYYRSNPPVLPSVEHGPDTSHGHHCIGRNKLSLQVDLSKPEAIALVKKLVSVSDVVIENFSPRVLPHYGLGYEDLCKVKPDIVMASLSAAGQYGPLRDIVTYGPSLSGLAGLDGLVGYYNENVLGMQIAYADPTAGTIGVFAVMSALMYREKTGKGQYIDMSQWEAESALMGEAFMDYAMNGRVHWPMGNRHRAMSPHGCYRCLGENNWITIAVDTEEEWQALRLTMGNPAWAESERFTDKYSRLQNLDELDTFITAWTSSFAKMELQEKLQAAGVAAMAVYNQGDRYLDPHWAAREASVAVPHPLTPEDVIYGVSWKFSETPGSIRRHAPLMGEHNKYILCDLLGLDHEELERLTEEKILY